MAGPRWWVAALLLVGALLAQTTLLHLATVRGVAPSLVLVIVVWYAIAVDTRRAAIFGMFAGLTEDVFAATTGGAWTVSTTLVAIIAGMLSRGFFADSIPLVAAITAFATLVRALVFWVVMAAQGYPSGLALLHFHQALLQMVLNAMAMAVFVLIVRRFENRT